MRKVLELPAFRRLLAVTMITEIALSIGAVALAVLVYRRTGSAIGAAAYFLCAEFGPAFISPLLVTRLDQRAARRVLPGLYVIEGLIFALLAWMVGHFSLAAVLALALIDGCLAVTARVLVRAAWTTVTTPVGVMREANAVVNAGFSVCFMIGPAIAGAIVASGGTRAALLVNVGVFAATTLIVASGRGLPRPESERAPLAGRLRSAAAYARSEPLLRRLLLLQAAAMTFFTISIPVEVVFAQRTLHAGAEGYGVLLAVWGGGTIAGSAIYARWRRLPPRFLITLGTVLLGLGFGVMAIAPSLAVAIVGATLAGAGNGSQIVAVRTTIQEAVDDRWMALVLSLNESIFQAVPGVGILLGGAITAVAGPRVALATAAAGSIALAILLWARLSVANAAGEILGPADAAVPEAQLTTAARQP